MATEGAEGTVGGAAAGRQLVDADQDRPLAARIEEALAALDELELDEHPDAYEAMDAAIRAELAGIEQLNGDRPHPDRLFP